MDVVHNCNGLCDILEWIVVVVERIICWKTGKAGDIFLNYQKKFNMSLLQKLNQT